MPVPEGVTDERRLLRWLADESFAAVLPPALSSVLVRGWNRCEWRTLMPAGAHQRQGTGEREEELVRLWAASNRLYVSDLCSASCWAASITRLHSLLSQFAFQSVSTKWAVAGHALPPHHAHRSASRRASRAAAAPCTRRLRRS